MKRIKFSFKYIIAFLLLLIVLVEIVAQVIGLGDPPLVELDDEIEYMLVPDKKYVRFGNSIEINSHRMRSASFKLQKSPGEFRLLLFGDSVVYGNHGIDQDDTIASNLEKLIVRDDDHLTVSVGSVAASSWGPPNILAFVKRFGTFNGDVAVLVLSFHDIADVPTFSKDIIPYRAAESISASHDLLQVLIERVTRLTAERKTVPFEKKRTASLEALDDLISILKNNFSTVLFLYHPNRSQILSCENDVKKSYEGLSKSHGINFNSLCKAYTDAESKGINVFSDDIHLSREGTRVVSLAIIDELKGLGALKLDKK
jgi:hypothetical protein